MISRLHCWWLGFFWTWLAPAAWATRLRLMVKPDGVTGWPYLVESGHLWDTDKRQFQVVGDTEQEWVPCARCGRLLYGGLRPYYGSRP